MLTSGSAVQVAGRLETLVSPYAIVPASAVVMPGGFCNPIEAWLGLSEQFLTAAQRQELVGWWLAVHRNMRLPSWDIVSNCTIEGRSGLVLVEAKANAAELKPHDSCTSTNPDNLNQIGLAITQAGARLNAILPGWGLRADSHYQLCNRFAWAWKLASMGVPVVLVYLGFLNADEMADVGRSFISLRDWAECVLAYADGVVPTDIWERRLDVNGTPMRAVIRSLDFRWGAFTH